MKKLPLIVLLFGLAAFFAAGGQDYLNFETLRDNHAVLTGLVQVYHWQAVGVFFLLYTLSVAFSFPGATILTLTGGFLFGIALGTVLAVVSATAGAVLLFLAVRKGFGDWLYRRAGPSLKTFTTGFERNAASYLLTLRLIPVFPFWLVNLAPACLGVSLPLFAGTTLVGIIPGTLVFTSMGSGLGTLFERNDTPDLSIIFTPEILLPLAGLSVLALLPVIYKWSKHTGVS